MRKTATTAAFASERNDSVTSLRSPKKAAS